MGFPSGSTAKESACLAGDARKMQIQSLGWEDPLEKEMATHSSILPWEIAWTVEPSGLQPMGSQRVIYSLATKRQQEFLTASKVVKVRVTTFIREATVTDFPNPLHTHREIPQTCRRLKFSIFIGSRKKIH